jgi:hypothetical protein
MSEKNRALLTDARRFCGWRRTSTCCGRRVRHKTTRPLLRTDDPRRTLGDPDRTRRRSTRSRRCASMWRRIGRSPDAEAVLSRLHRGRRRHGGGGEHGCVHDVHVALGARSYVVRIAPGLLTTAGREIADLLPRPRTWIVTERNVADLHLRTLIAGLAADGIAAEVLVLPPGEATKSWAHLTRNGGMAPVAEGRTPRRGHRLRRRGDRRSRGLRRRDPAARRALRAGADLASGAGRQLGRGQDRDQHGPWQEPGGRVPPAVPRAGRYRRAGHADRARFPRRLWRGGEIRASGRRGVLRLAGGERPARWPRATRLCAPRRSAGRCR